MFSLEKNNDKAFLISYKARYIYNIVEKDSLVNVGTKKEEMEEYRLDNKNDSKEKKNS